MSHKIGMGDIIPVDKLVHHVFEYQYRDILYLDELGEFQNARVWQIISHIILMSFWKLRKND